MEPQHAMSGMDAFAPSEIAALVETRGVAKANAPTVTTFILGVLAGAFIGLGAVSVDHHRDRIDARLRPDPVARRHRLLARADPGRGRRGRAVHGEQPRFDELRRAGT